MQSGVEVSNKCRYKKHVNLTITDPCSSEHFLKHLLFPFRQLVRSLGIQQESISLELSALHERSDNRSILHILKDESAKSNRKKRRALIYREGRNSKSCQTTRLTSLPIGAEKTINEKIYAGIYFATQFSKTSLFCNHVTFPF